MQAAKPLCGDMAQHEIQRLAEEVARLEFQREYLKSVHNDALEQRRQVCAAVPRFAAITGGGCSQALAVEAQFGESPPQVAARDADRCRD